MWKRRRWWCVAVTTVPPPTPLDDRNHTQYTHTHTKYPDSLFTTTVFYLYIPAALNFLVSWKLSSRWKCTVALPSTNYYYDNVQNVFKVRYGYSRTLQMEEVLRLYLNLFVKCFRRISWIYILSLFRVSLLKYFMNIFVFYHKKNRHLF